jgi:hypothetical protein
LTTKLGTVEIGPWFGFQGGIGLFRSFRMASSFLLRIHGFVKHGTSDTTTLSTNGF